MFKLIYKPLHVSSFKCIKAYQQSNQIQKIGHSGTLDPLASGLLLVATDEDTKLIPYLKNHDKKYFLKIELGKTSLTYDAEGPISFSSNFIPTKQMVLTTLKSFLGLIQQLPPKFSAKKINGKRAYDLARQAVDFQLKTQTVEIKTIENIQYNYPFIEFETHVSNGTYIRSLAHDIGQKLTTGAYLLQLERTMVNGLTLPNQNQDEEVFPEFNLTDLHLNLDQLKKLFYGQKIHLENLKTQNYLLKYQDQNIGILINKNNQQKFNLFGKKINQLF